MPLRMEVYTPELELIGLLEIYQSVIYSAKAFSAGTFSINSLMTEESRALLTPENIIHIDEETAGIIEYVKQEAGDDGPYITVKGFLLSGILERRILWGRYDLYGTPEEIMRYLVEDCAVRPTRGNAQARRIPGLVLAEYTADGGEKIRIQRTGGSLLETLEELGETYQIAFGIRLNPETQRMEFWTRQGIDRTVNQYSNEPVFYSTELDDVLESEYTYDSGRYKNITLVAGEGEGHDRVMITVQEEQKRYPCTVGYGRIGSARIGRRYY